MSESAVFHRWSARLKNSAIEVNGSVITRTTSYGFNRYGFTGICGLADSFIKDIKNRGKYKWAMKINRMQRWAYVGLCQIEQVQSHSFAEWNRWKIGNGHYCVCSDGLVFSNSDSDVNCQQKSFLYYVGDVLHFEYDSIIGTLIVTRNNRERYQMNIEQGNAKNYAICSYLLDN